MLQLGGLAAILVPEGNVNSSCCLFGHDALLSYILAFISSEYEAHLPNFRELVPCLPHSYQSSDVAQHPFFYVPCCGSDSALPHTSHPDGFVDEPGVLTPRAIRPRHSTMIAIRADAHVVILALLVI
jgi:hypothetical protein